MDLDGALRANCFPLPLHIRLQQLESMRWSLDPSQPALHVLQSLQLGQRLIYRELTPSNLRCHRSSLTGEEDLGR